MLGVLSTGEGVCNYLLWSWKVSSYVWTVSIDKPTLLIISYTSTSFSMCKPKGVYFNFFKSFDLRCLSKDTSLFKTFVKVYLTCNSSHQYHLDKHIWTMVIRVTFIVIQVSQDEVICFQHVFVKLKSKSRLSYRNRNMFCYI